MWNSQIKMTSYGIQLDSCCPRFNCACVTLTVLHQTAGAMRGLALY